MLAAVQYVSECNDTYVALGGGLEVAIILYYFGMWLFCWRGYRESSARESLMFSLGSNGDFGFATVLCDWMGFTQDFTINFNLLALPSSYIFFTISHYRILNLPITEFRALPSGVEYFVYSLRRPRQLTFIANIS